MNTRKVLFVAHVDSHIKAFHLPYIKMLSEEGFEVDVASNGEEKFENCTKKFNVSFQRSPLDPRNIKAFFQLKKIINEQNYELIHCHTPVGGIVARLASRLGEHYKTTKMVYTTHGFHFFKGNSKLKNLLFRSIESFAARYTDELITINKEDYAAAKRFKFKKNGKCHLVHGVGIDIQRIDNITGKRVELCNAENIPESGKILLSVGELNDNKNHLTVINSMKKLPQDYHYVICGVGDKRDLYLNLAKELGITNRLHLLGYRTDVIEIMKASDYFVFPSKREGLSVALMEAMASGLPCVASKIRGNSDLIDNGKGGYLINCDEFADKLPKVLEKTRTNIEDFKAFNKRKIKRFELYKVIEEVKHIYGI